MRVFSLLSVAAILAPAQVADLHWRMIGPFWGGRTVPPCGANTERGVFRSADGGKTFQRVLYKDENTGATEVVFDPGNSETLYATLWSGRQAPWETGWDGPGSGLFKSTDGGNTWRQLKN